MTGFPCANEVMVGDERPASIGTFESQISCDPIAPVTSHPVSPKDWGGGVQRRGGGGQQPQPAGAERPTALSDKNYPELNLAPGNDTETET